eukprot:1007552-Rhodomonas_salina.2
MLDVYHGMAGRGQGCELESVCLERCGVRTRGGAGQCAVRGRRGGTLPKVTCRARAQGWHVT